MKNEVYDMFYGASWIIHKQARVLRHRETETEKILWKHLCNKQLGVKFRRQHPINQFIADFYCHEIKLVIELDGPYHLGKEKMEYDDDRTKLFNEFRIKVIRFSNSQVLNNVNQILEDIKKRIEHLSESQIR